MKAVILFAIIASSLTLAISSSAKAPDAELVSAPEASMQIFSPDAPAEKSPDYYDSMAALSAQSEDWVAASQVYDEALKAFPRHPRLLHNAAALRDAWSRAALARREWDAALAACENALARSLMPDHFQHQIVYIAQEAGRYYLQAGDIVGLESWLARVRERFPKNPDLAKLTEALYTQGLEDLPLADDRSYINQGMLLLRSHQNLLGLEHPDRELVNNWCGRLLQHLWKQKEWASALVLIQTARELVPGDARLRSQEISLWDSQARDYIQAKQWDLALIVYDQALDRFPQEKLFSNNRNYCQQKKDRLNQSLQ